MAQKSSLNPCCSGQWYRTPLCFGVSVCALRILILVVVDDGIVLILSISNTCTDMLS